MFLFFQSSCIYTHILSCVCYIRWVIGGIYDDVVPFFFVCDDDWICARALEQCAWLHWFWLERHAQYSIWCVRENEKLMMIFLYTHTHIHARRGWQFNFKKTTFWLIGIFRWRARAASTLFGSHEFLNLEKNGQNNTNWKLNYCHSAKFKISIKVLNFRILNYISDFN